MVTKALTSPLSRSRSHCPCGSACGSGSALQTGCAWSPAFPGGWARALYKPGSRTSRLSKEPRWLSVRPCLSLLSLGGSKMHFRNFNYSFSSLVACVANSDIFSQSEARGVVSEPLRELLALRCAIVFSAPSLEAKFESLFRTYDKDISFQYFKSFKRVRVNFSSPLPPPPPGCTCTRRNTLWAAFRAAWPVLAPAFRAALRLLHRRPLSLQTLHIGSSHLAPPNPDKQFLISPPASPPVGWKQVEDATPVINYDLLYAISKLGPGDKYELHAATDTTPSVVVHVCESEQEDEEEDEMERMKRPKPKIIQTRRPEYTPVHLS
ncbi:hypothetical protein QTO34_014921 [Cnephaeus nilssonii]|uniref:Regulator of calcineurin 1 n=1 Tax=Cnephaeus nilssonii TaxID=3371016 RepID=A0AA40LUS9_CNENI|nr:hypothetical protein QTO34_014921 [Eptesicus nilssonii]